MSASNDSLVSLLKRESESLSDRLTQIVERKKFPKDVFVYNPLHYARGAYFEYLSRYARSPIRALFLGMNPGPNGMMQSGVPFGDIPSVIGYLKISGGVEKPKREHPRKAIRGFEWPRGEVSGARLWGYFRSCHNNASDFFQNYFVLNYCPLGFLSPTGSNLTPDKLPLEIRQKIENECDRFLLRVVPSFECKKLIGIGGYAAKVFSRLFPLQETISILHPSPASPAANRGWAEAVEKQLSSAKIPLMRVQ